jgi:putative endonuclease
VYILRSEKSGIYYKGVSADFISRFREHNEGRTRFTSQHCPWQLIYVEEHPDKRSALIRERKLKKCKAEYFEWLKDQPTNILLLPCHPG